MLKMNDVVAIGMVRTPMGRFGGTLKDVNVYDLGAAAIREALKRAAIAGEQVDQVIYGSCRQAGNGPNPSRSAALFAGLPAKVPTHTINMACPSGMKTVQLASQAIRLGDARIVVAGGMDSMSTIPYLLKGVRFEGFHMGPKTLLDGWSDSIDPTCGCGMGETAENLVDKYKLSREEQDRFAVESQQKAAKAQQEGWFDEELVTVEVPQKKGAALRFAKDESIRGDTSMESLAKLKPAFRKEGGSVTAGNACGMTDGACAIVLTSRENAKALGKAPLFSLVSYSETAVEPRFMGEGPGVAIPLALQAAGMKLADMDLLEVNEAFAAQVLTDERMLGWDRARLNVHGGAIALGHPTGISGARILITGTQALKRLGKEHLVASICGGGGVSMAMVVRRES
ncbi:MAG: thiolase family protein [Deltaproteobacteria bacterium]|nr:thiolase family protein [Deltaproteobacteria bacterium]